MGMKKKALDNLNRLVSILVSERKADFSEPFIPVSSSFDFIDTGDNINIYDLIFSSILQQREKISFFSSYYSGDKTLPDLEAIKKIGFQSATIGKDSRWHTDWL